MKKKSGNIIFLGLLVFVMCIGVSFAWYVWQGADIDVDVNFSGLDPYIEYSTSSSTSGTLMPSDTYKDGIYSNVSFSKKSNGDNLDVYGHIYLKVATAGNDKLFKASNLKWTLVSVTNNVESVISTGNFVGEEEYSTSNDNMIPANIDFNLTKSSDNTSYRVYVWVDEDAPMNVDISNYNIEVTTYAEADTNGNSDVGYIRNI